MVENKDISILAVDDEESVRKLFIDMFSAKGYKVITAANGEEAFAFATEQYFDVILVDLAMPVMDGYELCDKLRTHHRTEETPIIVVSGRDDWGKDIRDAFDVGANDYVIKGENFSSLAEKIENCIEVRKINKQENERNRKFF